LYLSVDFPRPGSAHYKDDIQTLHCQPRYSHACSWNPWSSLSYSGMVGLFWLHISRSFIPILKGYSHEKVGTEQRSNLGWPTYLKLPPEKLQFVRNEVFTIQYLCPPSSISCSHANFIMRLPRISLSLSIVLGELIRGREIKHGYMSTAYCTAPRIQSCMRDFAKFCKSGGHFLFRKNRYLKNQAKLFI
jgi:hypothetical protein